MQPTVGSLLAYSTGQRGCSLSGKPLTNRKRFVKTEECKKRKHDLPLLQLNSKKKADFLWSPWLLCFKSKGQCPTLVVQSVLPSSNGSRSFVEDQGWHRHWIITLLLWLIKNELTQKIILLCELVTTRLISWLIHGEMNMNKHEKKNGWKPIGKLKTVHMEHFPSKSATLSL